MRIRRGSIRFGVPWHKGPGFLFLEGASAGFVGLGTLSNHEKALLSESSFQKAAVRNAESNVGEVPLIKAYLAASLSTWWITALPSILWAQMILATRHGKSSACPTIWVLSSWCNKHSRSSGPMVPPKYS